MSVLQDYTLTISVILILRYWLDLAQPRREI
jgi:hypothetical protein